MTLTLLVLFGHIADDSGEECDRGALSLSSAVHDLRLHPNRAGSNLETCNQFDVLQFQKTLAKRFVGLQHQRDCRRMPSLLRNLSISTTHASSSSSSRSSVCSSKHCLEWRTRTSHALDVEPHALDVEQDIARIHLMPHLVGLGQLRVVCTEL